MTTRKERRQQVKTELSQEKSQRKERRIQIAGLPAEQRKQERDRDRTEKKENKKAHRKAVHQMDSVQRREAKRHDRTYRKMKNRTGRRIAWTAVLLLIVLGIYQIIPIIGGLGEITGIVTAADTPQGARARANAAEVAKAIADEGIVLLKNEGNALPLENRTINVFGTASLAIQYGGIGSGEASEENVVDLYRGLAGAGITYNEQLMEATIPYMGKPEMTGLFGMLKGMLFGKEIDEPDAGYLTDELMQQAAAFSPNALFVLTSLGIEASDFTVRELTLSQNKRDLLDRISEYFDNIILVINSGNVMELGFLEEYPGIHAVLWIGTPGPYGCQSLGRILTGEVNPSGRLVDTWAYHLDSAPALVNFGDFPYTNIRGRSFLNYQEGIYIGYRFYETFYENDEAGYWKAVQFPFGFGLGYTEFTWDVADLVVEEGTIQVQVEVTNTGECPGKDVVQVYYSAPYTPGGLEKSAVELGGYAKTSLLGPGDSETMIVSFAVRDMASYDMHDKQAYVLEEGDYQIRTGRNVHDIVRNELFEQSETIVYRTDDVTGTLIRNQFDYASGEFEYLTRGDWKASWPDISSISHEAPQHVVDGYSSKPAPMQGELPVTGADNSLTLSQLKGLDYDDEKWELFLDQFTIDEMTMLATRGAYQTLPVERLGVPHSVLMDGPAGFDNMFSPLSAAAAFPTEVVVASTWNDELAYRLGEAVGMEANAYGINGWYAPGMNIHRTPLGGRNFEYFSEDPCLSGNMAASMTKGAQSRNIIVMMKHFLLNEQETNARAGIFIWANEQALREIYLRPFEITVKKGGARGAMSSFIHIGHIWSGGNSILLQNVLRDEWGFIGMVTTDAALRDYMDVSLMIRGGNDLLLDVLITRSDSTTMRRVYREDPVGVTVGLRNCTHNICYSLVNYTELF